MSLSFPNTFTSSDNFGGKEHLQPLPQCPVWLDTFHSLSYYTRKMNKTSNTPKGTKRVRVQDGPYSTRGKRLPDGTLYEELRINGGFVHEYYTTQANIFPP
jgi:hypothetical protein